MSKTQENQLASKCPPRNSLPPPEVIWQGHYLYMGTESPCRVVLTHEWQLLKDAQEWTANPKIVYEACTCRDWMENWKYEVAPLTELPSTFFSDVMDAFRQVKS